MNVTGLNDKTCNVIQLIIDDYNRYGGKGRGERCPQILAEF